MEDPLLEEFKALRRKLFSWRSEWRAPAAAAAAARPHLLAEAWSPLLITSNALAIMWVQTGRRWTLWST